MSSKALVVVLAPEPIRPRMAGMGIRALELARALGADSDVKLLVPNDPAEAAEVAGDVPVVHAPPESDLARASAGATAAIVSGHAANFWFHQVPELPVATDLYDPFPIENLHYADTLGEETAEHDRATFALSLARSDFFLCASPEQRLFYAGALFAAGRVGPASFPADPGLERLLTVVPFGVPERPAAGDRSAGRRAIGLVDDGPLVLFGGIYDWSDPGPLLDAWPAVLEAQPSARLVFLDNPNPETTPQRVHARTQARAREIDPQGRSIVFRGWVPYGSREDLYAAADLLVSISSEGLETDLAYRTRLLDAAWGGVPSVTAGGGALARELEAAGAGRRVESGPTVLADAIVGLLGDLSRRSEMSRAARRFASGKAWRRVIAPLAAWCREARVDPDRLPFPESPEGRPWRRLSRALFR